jgi:DNA repair exonuclease SbcCD ATPase subunit
VTAESLEEEISELKILLEKINSATTLEELKELMSESMKMGQGHMRGQGPGMKMPEFETEEEELEFVKARTEESVERMIETLENIDVEKTDSANMASEDVEAILVQLEDIKSRLNSEGLTLEDLREIKESMSEIMDSIREAFPAPANERGAFPGHRGNREGMTA